MDIQKLREIANNTELSQEIRRRAQRLLRTIQLNYERCNMAVENAAYELVGQQYASTWEQDGLKAIIDGYAVEIFVDGVLAFHSGYQFAIRTDVWLSELLEAKQALLKSKAEEEDRRRQQAKEAASRVLNEAVSVLSQELADLPEPRYPVGTKVCWTKSRQPRTVFEVNNFDPITGTYGIPLDGLPEAVVPEDELYPADGPKPGDVAKWITTEGDRTIEHKVTILSYEGEGNFKVADPGGISCESLAPASELSENEFILTTPWWKNGAYHDCDISQLDELAANGVSFEVLHPAADDDGDLTLTRVRITDIDRATPERQALLRAIRWIDQKKGWAEVKEGWGAADIRSWLMKQVPNAKDSDEN
jgi:hypothetical protein